MAAGELLATVFDQFWHCCRHLAIACYSKNKSITHRYDIQQCKAKQIDGIAVLAVAAAGEDFAARINIQHQVRLLGFFT